jgi:FkbM family methyltransferase
MAVSSEFVSNAYRVLLGREPDPQGLRHHMTSDSEDALLQNILGSLEFYYRRPAIAAPNAWVWADTQFGFRLHVNLADANVSRDILRNEFETLETKLVVETVREGDTVLDIGANIGFYTNLLCKCVGARGRVHAFEGLPFLAEQVQASVNENGFHNRVTLHSAALSDRGGQATMVYSERGNMGGGHLAGAGSALPGQIEMSVAVTTLNALPRFERLDFIKIDVEGAELLALKPFIDELARLRPVILSELHPGQLRHVSNASPTDYINLLTGLHYSCRRIDNGAKLDSYNSDSVVSVVFLPEKA